LYEGACAAGAAKAAAPFMKIFQLGVVAGAHIAFGAYLATTVGGNCPGIAASNPGLQKVSLQRDHMHLLHTSHCSLPLALFNYVFRLFRGHLDFPLD
jgi:hypothetical protein